MGRDQVTSNQVGTRVSQLILVFALVVTGVYVAYTYSSGNKCARPNLTSEECANLGTHQYHTVGTISPENCTFEGASGNISNDEGQKIYESNSTKTFDFQENVLLITTESGDLVRVAKIGANTYSYQEGRFDVTYVFNKLGYVMDAKATPGQGCDTHYEMTLISPE